MRMGKKQKSLASEAPRAAADMEPDDDTKTGKVLHALHAAFGRVPLTCHDNSRSKRVTNDEDAELVNRGDSTAKQHGRRTSQLSEFEAEGDGQGTQSASHRYKRL